MMYHHLLTIGTALTTEKNLEHLLETIVEAALEIAGADGGSLYIVSEDKKWLNFKIIRNVTKHIRMGGTEQVITWPPIPLYLEDGSPNMNNVCSACANLKREICIDDVYSEKKFDLSGTKKADEMNDYHSESMAVAPMIDHQGEVIGVLQLINARYEGGVGPFQTEDMNLVEALASHAAVALTNSRLVGDLRALLEAIVETIAGAVDAKSKYTSGHVRRVVKLTMMICSEISKSEEPPFRDVCFSDEELKEIRVSALLHDVGKIITPEYVMDKATKLDGLWDRIGEVKCRLEILRLQRRVQELEEKLGESNTASDTEIDNALEFVETINEGGEFLSDEKLAEIERLKDYSVTIGGKEEPLLPPEVTERLSIRKGTLTFDERKIIQEHVTHSWNMLSNLPFPKDMKKVPDIASNHHEHLDGSGYPRKLNAEQLDLPSRVLAIADVFEALTARDRPYKKPKPLSEAVKIMRFMIKDHHLDGSIFDFFTQSGLLAKYSTNELLKEQCDIDL